MCRSCDRSVGAYETASPFEIMLFRKFKDIFAWMKQARSVVIVFSAIFVVAALPWNRLIDTVWKSEFIGLPMGFLIAILILPIAGLFLLSAFVKRAEDIDRHDPALENE